MQADFYDSSLRNRLNSSNNSHPNNQPEDIEDIVMNKEFLKWEGNIRHNLDPKSYIKEQSYTSEEDLALFKEVKKHVDAHNKPIRADNAIVLTHTFYLHMGNMGSISTDRVRGEANDFLSNALWLFGLDLPREKVGIVALETVHHYAAATSIFMENGAIDHVVLTGIDCGCPVDDDGQILNKYGRFGGDRKLNVIYGKRVFAGGVYNNLCLNDSNGHVRKQAKTNDFWAIYDLIINSPLIRDHFNHGEFTPRTTIRPAPYAIGSGLADHFPRSRVITLTGALRMMGCEEYSRPN